MLKTYTVNYLYQGKEQYFIYNSVNGVFPHSEEMLHLAMADSLQRHDPNQPQTNVELISIALDR